MKTKLLIFVLVLMVLSGCQQKRTDAIEIGAIVPLTGYSAITGGKFMQGLELAVEEINQENLPFSFKIIIEDSKSTGKDAHNAYRKLAGRGVKYFAAFGGQFVMGFAAETNNSDKVLFTSAAPNSNLLSLTNRCFRLYPTIDMLTDEVKNHILQHDYKRIAVINAQNEAYSMCAEYLIRKMNEVGKDVVLKESYDPSCQDFKNIVNKIASHNIDFIYSAGLGESSALLTKQIYLNPQTSHIPIIGDMNYSNPENLAIIGEIKSPIYIVDSYIDSSFKDAYYAKYNQMPNALSAYGYSIPYMLKEAFLSLGVEVSTDEIFNYIKSGSFETAAGTISFDSITSEPILDLITNSKMPE